MFYSIQNYAVSFFFVKVSVYLSEMKQIPGFSYLQFWFCKLTLDILNNELLDLIFKVKIVKVLHDQVAKIRV